MTSDSESKDSERPLRDLLTYKDTEEGDASTRKQILRQEKIRKILEEICNKKNGPFMRLMEYLIVIPLIR